MYALKTIVGYEDKILKQNVTFLGYSKVFGRFLIHFNFDTFLVDFLVLYF